MQELLYMRWWPSRVYLISATAPHAADAVSNRRFLKLETDKAAVERSLPMLSSKLDVYDAILGKQKYLAGNVRTCFC
jgi:glutathione S-transferase